MCSRFGLLYTVALHYLAVTVDANVPRASRLALAVQHGGVRHIVVLKHTLFEFALGVEMLLPKNEKHKYANKHRDLKCMHIRV